MSPLPGKKILPITPTADEDRNPTACQACGRIALGIGRAIKAGGKVIDNGYLCRQCIVAVSDLSRMDRLSVYELRALDAGVAAVGEYMEERGLWGVGLESFDELDRRMLVKAAWAGCAAGVRAALKEPPF